MSFYWCAVGEQIEMGGIVDPERGALIYRKTTKVETIDPEEGSDFTIKKVKKVTSETSWLGQGNVAGAASSDKTALITAAAAVAVEEIEEEVKPWHDEEIDVNPLYSSTDYISDFQNPLYTNRQSTTVESEDKFLLVTGGKEKSRVYRGRPGTDESGQGYMDYLSAQPGLDTADTLF